MANRKIGLVVIVLTGFFCVSGANNPPKSVSSGKVSYENREFHKQYVVTDSTLLYIDMHYPYIFSVPNSSAKDSINLNVKKMLLNGPPYAPDDAKDSTYKQGNLNSFDELASYLLNDFVEGMPGEGWLYRDSAWIAGDTCNILSIADDHVDYVGGAHQTYGRYFLNFNIFTGRQVYLADVLKKGYENKLRKIVHNHFRQVRKEIPMDSSLMDTSFWVGGSSFPITKNYSIGNNGITFYYNPYEILSFADGVTELLIKYDEIKDLIDDKGLLKRPLR